MQKLALLMLMAITASMMFSLNASVFAQSADTSDSSTDESMNDATSEATPESGETTEDQSADTPDTTTDESMADDSAMQMTTTASVQAPLQQLMGGADPHNIACGEGLQLVYKASNFQPACVKDSTYQILIQRGWASAGVPSDDDLMSMVNSLPKPAVDETPDNPEVNVEEGVTVDGQSTTGNDTNPNPQSFNINLSESMEMGAN